MLWDLDEHIRIMDIVGYERHGRLPEHDFDYYLNNRLIFDTAGFCCATRSVETSIVELDPGRIVFAPDYPQEIREPEAVKECVDGIRALGANVALRRPNLYLSPDMYLANMPGMDDYLRAANGFLADRFIFAMSYPFCPVAGYADCYRTLSLSDEAFEKTTYRNAARILGLESS